jgi:hypothetical protein
VDHTNPLRVAGRQGFGDVPGAVGAAIVDDDEAVLVTTGLERRQKVGRRAGQVVLLAIGGHDDGNASAEAGMTTIERVVEPVAAMEILSSASLRPVGRS